MTAQQTRRRPTLDDLFETAEIGWRQWVREHPEVDLTSDAREQSQMFFGAMHQFAGVIASVDEDTLKRLAVDARVWKHVGIHPVQGETIEQAVGAQIEEMLVDRLDQLRKGAAS